MIFSIIQFGVVSKLQKLGDVSKGSHTTKIEAEKTLQTISFQKWERKWQERKGQK